ncbi:MAG TPA: DUF1573 domain-containing protein [Puia sp.]|nr:DUF1573 domain-containing protein [Puia sp.]
MKILHFLKRSIILFACLFAISSAVEAQNSSASITDANTAKNNDVLLLKEPKHDFGKIPQGRPATYVFEIVNTGTEPLILENVQASCGCTTPEWSKAPIAAGSTAPIKVGYNAYAEGHFNKTVTIFYGNHQTKTLMITGEVYKSPVTSAPENSSVQLLKQINQ